MPHLKSSLDEFMEVANESLISRKRSVSELLASAERSLNRKLKTIGDCDDYLAIIKSEGAKFNECIRTLQKVKKKYDSGKLNNRDYREQLTGAMALLRSNCNKLQVKLGNIVDDTRSVSKKDLSDFNKYITGLKKIVSKRKKELVKAAKESMGEDFYTIFDGALEADGFSLDDLDMGDDDDKKKKKKKKDNKDESESDFDGESLDEVDDDTDDDEDDDDDDKKKKKKKSKSKKKDDDDEDEDSDDEDEEDSDDEEDEDSDSDDDEDSDDEDSDDEDEDDDKKKKKSKKDDDEDEDSDSDEDEDSDSESDEEDEDSDSDDEDEDEKPKKKKKKSKSKKKDDDDSDSDDEDEESKESAVYSRKTVDTAIEMALRNPDITLREALSIVDEVEDSVLDDPDDQAATEMADELVEEFGLSYEQALEMASDYLESN